MNMRIEKEFSPPAVAAAGGERTSSKTRVEALYFRSTTLGKAKGSGAKTSIYRSDCGRVWSHKGKVGRVLVMLANTPSGITQYSTYPWHTRLAASIQVLRDSGLAIETTREGEFRHGRYRLLTKGALIEQPDAEEFGL